VSVDVPRDYRFYAPFSGPHLRFGLPIAAAPRRAVLGVGAGILGLMGAGSMAMGTMLLAHAPLPLPSWEDWFTLGVALFTILAGALFSGLAVFFASDALRTAPVLVIAADGLRDSRVVREPIAWDGVARPRSPSTEPAPSVFD
jgi:hypothetical protein